MNLHRVIVHELIKDVKSNVASTYLSNKMLEVNDMTTSLVEKLNDSYRKDRIINAIFSNGSDKFFPLQFKNYVNKVVDDQEFIDFSRLSLSTLRGEIQNIFFAKGGYFVYADYTVNAIRYTGVYLVRDTDGVLFKKNNKIQSFDIDSIKYMNTDKLAMGCRINNTNFGVSLGKYLSLINNKQSDISDYFSNWVCALKAESSTDCTNMLYDVINKIDLPVNPATNSPYDLDSFRRLVVDYIKSQPNNIVNLHQMSSHFYENENIITDFIHARSIELDHEFKVDGKALRKFYKLEVNSDGIQLRFTRGDFNKEKIKLSGDNPNVVIIESERFANALRREIQS
ncbi:nucleoid-associated protein [Rufibacter immobilis]|uniref:nucleoid-associated protein n=1 Tax=Rufibacter immobilis TaxID=1348778 RepID=UPI0035EFF014